MKGTRWFVAALAAAGVAAVCATAGVGSAGAARAACGVTVKAMDGEKIAINKYDQDEMRFVPGAITIKSGCMLTF